MAEATLLVDEQRGDEVPGQHEEHVDADEPATEPGQVEVVGHHQDQRDGPEPVERAVPRHVPPAISATAATSSPTGR